MNDIEVEFGEKDCPHGMKFVRYDIAKYADIYECDKCKLTVLREPTFEHVKEGRKRLRKKK